MIQKKVQVNVIPGGKNSEWVLLAADCFARLKRGRGEDVRVYAPPSDFSQTFRISAVKEEKSDININPVIDYLILHLQQSGDIYLKNAECMVCEHCGQLQSGENCLVCGATVIRAERACYFLRIHRHVPAITEVIRSDLILPAYLRNDLTNSLSQHSQEDILAAVAVSREEKIIVPADWLRNLSQALARCGYPSDSGAFQKLWAETFIFVSRSMMDYIFSWCGVLTALQLPIPGGIICHNFLVVTDRKGQEVSPILLAQNYGYESLRYFIVGVKTTPGENNYSEDQVIQRINLDLANELGNLVSRVVSLLTRFGEGMIPAPDILTRQTGDLELRETALDTPRKLEKCIETQELHLAVKAIKTLVGKTNRFIESTLPWQLAETPGQQARLNTVLYNLSESLRFLAVSLVPLLPEAALSIQQQLGIDGNLAATSWQSLQQWGRIPVGSKITEQPALFPRIVPGYGGIGPELDLIMREDLARINMVVARIVSAEQVPDYEGLFQLILYDGRQRCRVLAPVAHSYAPDYLPGKKVVLIANLRPIEIEGLHSEGEVLVVESETGSLVLIFLDDQVPEGSKVLCLS